MPGFSYLSGQKGLKEGMFMNLRRLRRDKRAFTLVEIIIATSILAFLMITLHRVFWASSSAWKKGDARIEMYQNGRVCLDVMSREIRCALISPGNSQLVFKGDEDALSYVSTFHKPNKTGEFDLFEIGYSLSSKGEVLRRAKAHLDSSPGRGGATAVLANNILQLTFLYNNEGVWQDRWDSSLGTPDDTKDDYLPQAVQIDIIVQDEQGLESPLLLSTAVTIPTGGR